VSVSITCFFHLPETPAKLTGMVTERGKVIHPLGERRLNCWDGKDEKTVPTEAVGRILAGKWEVKMEILATIISRPRLMAVFVVAALSVLTPPIHAQSSNRTNAECKAADLDASFVVLTGGRQQSVILQLRNISQTTCNLRGGQASSGFLDVTLGPSGNYAGSAMLLHECTECDAGGNPDPRRYTRMLSLEPGGEAYRVYAWPTEPADAGSPCMDADGMYMSLNSDVERHFEVVAPALIGKICPPVQVSAYQPGDFDEGTVNAGVQEKLPAVSVATDKADNVVGELVVLHVTAAVRGPLDKDSCPILFFRVRAEDGAIRFLQDVRFHGCKIESSGTGGDKCMKEDLISNGPFGMNQPGKYDLTVSELTAQTETGRSVMITSSPLQLRFADPSTLKRAWAPHVRGLSIALNLDQDTYELGQDIHLHAVLEDFEATPVIYRSDCMRPVTFEVRDASGQLVREKTGITTGYPTLQIMTCHVGMSLPFPKKEAVPMESTLREWGLLPDYAGNFTIMATWSALGECEQDPPPDALGRCLQSYAVVQSEPLTFHITEKKSTHF
jgi:hypothetical protein